MTETFHLAGERYRVVKSIEHWYVIDTEQMRPRLAEFHVDCPDAEKMAKSLASWLNSGPEDVETVLKRLPNNLACIDSGSEA